MKPHSFLWLSGWSVPASVWEEQISYWPEAIHRRVDFSSCENKEDVVPFIHESLSQLPEPVCVVAWSLGGLVALEVLKKASRKISSLFLVSVGAQFVRSVTYPYGWDQRILQRMKKQIQVNKGEVIDRFDQNMFLPFTSDMKWESLRKEAPSTTSLLAGLDYLMHFKMDPSIDQVDKPVFLLAGALDQISSTKGTVHLHQSIPHSTQTIWENTGHIPFWNQKHRFHQWMKNCMRSTPKIDII